MNEQIHPFPKRPRNDVEKLIADIKHLFSKIGFGSGNGGSHNNPSRSTRNIVILLAVLIVVAWGALSSFYTIDVSEEGVVTRFGRYLKTTQPGPHFKLPFGIDSVYKVASKRTLQEEFGFRTVGIKNSRSQYSKDSLSNESLMLTGDLNVADVEWAVQYRIRDPWKFLFHARDVKRNIRDVSMSIMRRVVGDRLADEVLTTGRVEIAGEAKRLTQEVLDEYDMGIHIERVVLQDVNPPDPVKPAFNEVNAAKQEQEETINNAERQYNKVIPEARGKAEQLLADAEAHAIDVVNRAKGDAAMFNQVYREYKKAPNITRERVYLEAMETVFKGVKSFTIVDKDLKGILPVYGKNISLDSLTNKKKD